MSTKWDYLCATERAELDVTSLNVACAGCGENLATEGHFARHFILIHGRPYLNLGRCPNKETTLLSSASPAEWLDGDGR